MRELPAGRDAVLLDFSDSDVPWRSALDASRRLRVAAADGHLPGVVDVVPAEFTVLVQCAPRSGVDRLGIRRTLRRREPTPPDTADAEDLRSPVLIDVRYDGPDLGAVADAAGLDTDQVVAAHTGTTWRVQFMGFAPGFGYLVPHGDDLDAATDALCRLPRRQESRPSVPSGSVALAAGYSAVYPRSSPGGWHLVGRCDVDLWDVAADPPAVLAPGRLVRFTAQAT